MSETVRKVRGKHSSIFDIEELTEDNIEIPSKKKKNENEDNHKNENESQLFEDDGFDDLDISLAETECENNDKKEGSTKPSIIYNDDVNAQQRERAEKNRQKALALKRAKLVPRQTITKDTRECFLTGESLESQSQSSHFTEKKTIDTGAGFFIEEEEDDKTER